MRSSLVALVLSAAGASTLVPLTAPATTALPGPAASAVAAADRTVTATGAFAGSTAAGASALATSTAAQTQALADEVADEVATAVDQATAPVAPTVEQAVEQALWGELQVCPGVPASAGLSLRPRDLLTVTVPLRTPQAVLDTVTTAVDEVEVDAPSPAELLEDPARVSLSPTGTGATVEAGVVDVLREGTSVGLPAVRPGAVTGAAASDVRTAASLLPRLEVGVGASWRRVEAEVSLTTTALGGPLRFRLGQGSSCTAVSYTVVR